MHVDMARTCRFWSQFMIEDREENPVPFCSDAMSIAMLTQLQITLVFTLHPK
jgi:hypothetical protein